MAAVESSWVLPSSAVTSDFLTLDSAWTVPVDSAAAQQNFVMGRDVVFRWDFEKRPAEAFTKSLPDARHRNQSCKWEVRPLWRSGRTRQCVKRGNGKRQSQWDRLDASVEKRGGGAWVCFHWESWDESCLCVTKIIIQLYWNHENIEKLKPLCKRHSAHSQQEINHTLFHLQSKQPKGSPWQLKLSQIKLTFFPVVQPNKRHYRFLQSL